MADLPSDAMSVDIPAGGPWCDEDMANWWVLADDAASALRAVLSTDVELDPGYFGPYFMVWRVLIRWENLDPIGLDRRIVETMAEANDTVEAWHVCVGDFISEGRPESPQPPSGGEAQA